jgi:O-antigen/teichoic acid export membrane protein
MRTEKRILTNTAVLGLGEVVGQVATLVFVVVCARAFGTGVLGWYSIGMAVGAITTVLVGLGTHTRLLTVLAQRPEESDRRIGGTLPYQLLLSFVLAGLVVLALALFVDDPIGRWIVAALSIYHLLIALSALLLIPFRARQIMWPSALTGAMQRVAVAAVTLALIGLGAAAVPVFGAFPATAAIVAAVSFAAASRFLNARLGRKMNALPEQRALYSEGMPFLGVAVLDVVYSRLGLLLLTVIVGAESAGIYTAAERLLIVVSIFRVLFLGALFPAVAHFAATDRNRALELANRSMRLILVLTIPAAGLLAIFHREIIALMFGDAFAESAPVLLLLTPLLIIRGINGLWANQATAIGLQRAVVAGRALMVTVFVVAGAGLVAVAGPIGLAFALMLAECVYALALRAPLVAHAFLAPSLPLLGRPLVGVAAGALAHVALSGLPLALHVAAVVAATATTMFLLGAVRVHDLRYLRAVLSHPSTP